MGDDSFYADLEPLTSFSDVPDPGVYHQAPDSWNLVITDVQGSTKAIEAGRYKDVNALGVASIVAVRNAVDVPLPFVFGGDGATLLCPTSHLEQLEPALRGLQQRATDAFGLGMRAGIVPIGELREAGHPVLVARYRQSEHATFAMFAGSGLSEGERWIKDPERGARYAVQPGPAAVDFSGFECRWEPIASTRDHILALLVQARASDRREASAIYKAVIATVEEILEGDGHPVAMRSLQLATQAERFDAEARLLSGRPDGFGNWMNKTRAALQNRIGTVLMDRGWDAFGFPGEVYREQVVANTDFRKFDDTLRMVIDVTSAQERAIADYLEREHAAGTLVYGLHRAPSALMTCVITEHRGDHVHFVDGADGGYALAAKQLKAQLKSA
ncbi:MAG: adenylate cyclase [Sandaracinus sp.]|nr:adenylate cyclase [Sandaracinus sp.]|tara:strand:+ start:1194 stop:2354 length:1161 start_codon:yes stop_codon:yes gene_type:complete